MKRAKKGYIVPKLGEVSELIAVLVAFDIPSGNDQMPTGLYACVEKDNAR